MDDLLNFETSFTGENDSDDDLLTSDNENDRTAPSSNIPPTAPQHQKPVSGHDSYSSGADILTSSPDAPPPAQRFSFLSEKKASKTRTNSLYQDAQKRQEKLEKLRQKKFEDEYGKGNFQVSPPPDPPPFLQPITNPTLLPPPTPSQTSRPAPRSGQSLSQP